MTLETRTHPSHLMAAMVMALTLAGCGGGGTGDAAADSPETSATPPLEADETDGIRQPSADDVAAGVTWVLLAGEGKSFSVPADSRIRYGVDGRWVEKTVTGAGTCSNNFFGSDPRPGKYKFCYVAKVAPVGTSGGYSPVTHHSTRYCEDGVYPAQWTWRPESTVAAPLPATGGTPLIKHLRNGVVIATYSQLSGDRSAPNNTDGHDRSVGPFRRAPYTQMADGDVFEIYPAVYEGEAQQIYLGENVKNDADYTAGIHYRPRNITIRGVTVDGRRPVIRNPATGASNATLGQALVYIADAENITIENLDIADSPTGGGVGKAGMYVNGAKNLTLRNVRVSGFKLHGQNGIFGTSGNTGTFLMQNVELADNGGNNGPEHNIYMNASATDPQFTVKMQGSWSHGAYYGHLFKSRAQVNVLEGNYFQGSRSTGSVQTENYLVDIPEGGTLTARNNVFAKGFSGDSSNGAAITFAVESGSAGRPFDTARPWGLTVEHNTFVAFSKTYDSQGHPLYPFFLNASAPLPGGGKVIERNVFVGYCPSTSQVAAGYYGGGHSVLNFNDIDLAFRPRAPMAAAGSTVVGKPAYAHQLRTSTRATAAMGAVD